MDGAAEAPADGLANGTSEKKVHDRWLLHRAYVHLPLDHAAAVLRMCEYICELSITLCIYTVAEEEDTEVLLARRGGSRVAGSKWTQRTRNREAGAWPLFAWAGLISWHILYQLLFWHKLRTERHAYPLCRRRRKRRLRQSSHRHSPCCSLAFTLCTLPVRVLKVCRPQVLPHFCVYLSSSGCLGHVRWPYNGRKHTTGHSILTNKTSARLQKQCATGKTRTHPQALQNT